MRVYVSLAVFLLIGSPVVAGADLQPQGGQVILDETSYWRCLPVWRPPIVRTPDGLAEFKKESGGYASAFIAFSEPPPAEWIQPDFFDGEWERWRLARTRRREVDYGFRVFGAFSPTLAVQCLRGKFTVEDPDKVKGMTLAVSYRGGVVVYLNGKEIARGSLPADGKIEPLTLAADYPPEAFTTPGVQRGSNCILAEFGHPRAFKDRCEKRIRRLGTITIKPANLRKGINVLALEFHRAPYFGIGLRIEGMNHESVWSTCGLVNLQLRATAGVEPNTSRPDGLQVWNSSVMERLTPADYGNPSEPRGPIVIPAARNGIFTGKVAVTSDEAIKGLKAEVSDLVHRNGAGRIAAANAKVLYTIRDDRTLCRYRAPLGFYDTLVETPPAEVQPGRVRRVSGLGALLPIWIKVKVPADAAPGEYEGTVTVSVSGARPTKVPVRLRVADWTLPDRGDFVAHLGFIQSPDTLALFYKVPQWSEEHWKLIERSFELMGEMGNGYVVIPMICRTNFGNEQTMIRWIRKRSPASEDADSSKYRHDFTVFDRYLDLAQKHMKPDVVCLYVWERYIGEFYWAGVGERKGKPPLVTRFDPTTAKAEDMETPEYGTPEAKAFWAPVYKGLRARLKKRGLLDVTMMGMNGDAYRPTKAMFAMLRELMPGNKWIANSHGDVRGRAIGGIPVGYNTAVYVNVFRPPTALSWDANRKIGWRLTNKVDLFNRSGGPATGRPLYHTQHLGVYRQTMEAAFYANYSGVGRAGFDFWPVLGRKDLRPGVKHSATVCGRYPPCWDQLNLDRATENVVSPGPNGALPTERFENIREGMQECEARAFVEQALIAPARRARLGDDLAKRLQSLLDARQWRLRGACNAGFGFQMTDAESRRVELYEAAAAVAARLAAE